jgi:hypothetical protein
MTKSKERVVLVSGSRDWGEDRLDVVRRELAHFPAGTWIIHGYQRKRLGDGYSGVDWLSDTVAQERGFIRILVPYVRTLGASGGPVRNRAMVDIACALMSVGHSLNVIFFHDNITRSRGTKDCLDAAERMGLMYEIVEE